MAITMALRKQARAWCRNRWGLTWHEDGLNKERMTEAYAALMPPCTAVFPPVKCLDTPDAMLFLDREAGFYVDLEMSEDPAPAWAEDGGNGRIGGYHAVALPTPQQLWEDELTVAGCGRAYQHDDLARDWALLRAATDPDSLRPLTCVEWGQHTPEDEHEGLITAYGPFPAITEYVAFLQHSYDSHPGYTAHWLDEVPAETKVGETVTLPDGRRALLMDEWLLPHVRPRINAQLPPRTHYPPAVLPSPLL